MGVTRTLTVNGREEWRSWLEANHAHEREIWLIFYRKATGKQTVSLPEAQDEAICFGWVDSTEKKIDRERYALRFTPRKPGSHWSEGYLSRARRLIAEGTMTVSGFGALPAEYREELSGLAIMTGAVVSGTVQTPRILRKDGGRQLFFDEDFKTAVRDPPGIERHLLVCEFRVVHRRIVHHHPVDPVTVCP